MHEATRKLLGVLLREMDGFDAGKKSTVIGATNRRVDLVCCTLCYACPTVGEHHTIVQNMHERHLCM